MPLMPIQRVSGFGGVVIHESLLPTTVINNALPGLVLLASVLVDPLAAVPPLALFHVKEAWPSLPLPH